MEKPEEGVSWAFLSAFNELHEIAGGNRIEGVLTGFKDIDEILVSLDAGDLVVIASRPSLGKTALALNIASRAA